MPSQPAWFRPGIDRAHSPMRDVRSHVDRFLTRRNLQSIMVVLATARRPAKYYEYSRRGVMLVPNLLKSWHDGALFACCATELPMAKWPAGEIGGGRPTAGRGGVTSWLPPLRSNWEPPQAEVMRGRRECGNVHV